MQELSLVNCIISPGRGLACVLGKFRNLEKIRLDMRVGVRNSDISLKVIALNCPMLETVRISFSDGEFPSFSSFTLNGILSLIQNCLVRELALDHVYSFTDIGMEALCSAQHLETLELVRCQEISDEGLQLVSRFPRIRVLRLSKCLGITDDGFKTLVGSYKLDLLAVEDSPQTSERAIYGAARSILFRRDLSCMY
ncbi:F-box/LRR-repeat protein 14 [Hibiscus syriacus]|uniref:F-box/LRR-repeat protein 14 n=1 Tax=Hibiscus syriacus TaxID=106335 RepID=A0A6A3BSX4_HIBSY|nr:F-box/LRR-repeat protein 14-like [Hibiscus syriacus]KAE8718092.1 F-box/LRR-repeat protein 14 [Hibiscus syriacus]